ncbi:MAG: FAD-dependent monooxygenase, partial [Treponema sp.]|nr:FAD-dependent monooxygenase [Treponema sp.]
MIYDLSISVAPEDEKNASLINRRLFDELKKSLPTPPQKNEIEFVFVKRSVDARHGRVKIFLKYKAYVGQKPDSPMGKIPEWKQASGDKTVIIVGSGPAGLFVALKLLEYGIKPVIVERGSSTSKRKRDIACISTKGNVDENSNYCFGEGGAGTFSDGKLYTRSNKRGDIGSVLQLFVYFGADKKILTDAHPHIGTDKLPSIINAMCDLIREKGGQVLFDTKCTELITDENGSRKTVRGIKIQNTLTEETAELYGDKVILATGHSAYDIYTMIADAAPQALEAKTIAVGVRVEHPREVIDSIQYHDKNAAEKLGAAEYRVTTQQDGRGVYSFCMCPGGFVVPSASAPDEIVVNGMSAAKRNSAWSNAAIVVETRPEDVPDEYVKEAEEKFKCPSLAGLLWRKHLEKLASQNGDGQKAPAQRLTDFLEGKKSTDLPKSSYTPGLVSSNLNDWLPHQIADRLKGAFREIDGKMKGYIRNDALMIAIETRTSTPVRILRDKEKLECTAISNLYPAGEGSGYSGGIVSSALDGIKVAEKICNS